MGMVRMSLYSTGVAVFLLWLFSFSFGGVSAHAVLFTSTGDPNYNTTAPTGTLTNSGWQYQGYWGGFLGTPIAPTYFIAAKHVGGTVGQSYMLDGVSYTTVTNFAHPSSDLIIWKVAETLPIYAPLYTKLDEIGRHLVVFGRGTQRGSQVKIGPQVKGWAWGIGDGVRRWGENDVTTITTNFPNVGDLLTATFDRNATPNECHLSTGDSSGAVFIQDGGTWKLAGINYAVTDPFVSTNGQNGSGFNAALVDYGGLYTGGDGQWVQYPDSPNDIPAAFYSTRISANLTWIASVIDFELGSDMHITDIAVAGNDIQITFTTAPSRAYRVQRLNDIVAGGWADFTNNVPGTGSPVTVTDVGGALQPGRNYRIAREP